MIKLSASTACSLFALRYLSQIDRPAGAAEIARFGRLDPSLVAAALGRLRRAGLVRQTKGRGFTLAKAPGEISAFDVAQAVDRPVSPSGHCEMDYETCVFKDACPLSPLCTEVHESTVRSLRSFTVADLGEGMPSLPPYAEKARRKPVRPAAPRGRRPRS